MAIFKCLCSNKALRQYFRFGKYFQLSLNMNSKQIWFGCFLIFFILKSETLLPFNLRNAATRTTNAGIGEFCFPKFELGKRVMQPQESECAKG